MWRGCGRRTLIRSVVWALVLCLGSFGVGPRRVAAQAADITDAVSSAMAALNAGDVAGYLAHFSPQARVLISFGESVEVDAATLGGRLGDLAWTSGPISPQIFGGMAVTVLSLDGALRVPGGEALPGPWRYAETRVRSGSAWRIAQVELSPLDPPTESAASGLATPQGVGRGPDSAGPGGDRDASGANTGRTAPTQAAGVSADQPEPAPTPPDVPPAPRAPEVISRNDAGDATVRAVRLDGPLDIDGELNEPVYGQVPALSDFIQSLPDEGVPATELTEAWILYDDENVYVSARVHEEVPEDQWTANEMRRDATQVGSNDNFGLVFDTYYDRRNGYFFYTNPLGAMIDVQVTNEGSPNFDWNPVWAVRTGRFDGGWTVEVRIPFKSIKYRPGASQVWGVQLRRAIRRKNEWSHLTFVPRAAATAGGRNGIIRMSRAATLVGLEAPPIGLSLDVKPYGIGSLTTDRTAASPKSNELDGSGGVDLKWGVTQNLTADFTYNTDFAQVEVDQQQVNLTRFSLFFPEKREFFLESRGIFNFPSSTAGGGGGRGGGTVPTLFFSRRIGILGRTPVPIIGGGRVTGKVGPFDVGAIDIVTDDVSDIGAQMTNFTVLRLRADVLQRSNIGGLYTRRSRSLIGGGPSETYGADASFSFLDDWYLSGYLSRTRAPGVDSLDVSYQGRFNYEGDLLGLQASHLLVEDEFNPEVGFRRRWGFRQSQASGRISPRPSIESIRQVTLQGRVDYYENAEAGFVESREIGGSLGVELENSDQVSVNYTNSYENLLVDESISGATVTAGRHSFDAVQASYIFGPQRFFSGNVSAQYGTWFNGHLTSVGMSRGRVELHPQLSLEPSISFNRVELPAESVATWLAVTRVNYTFSPRMFLSALVQYNSSADSFSANARFRWEYAPGSEIFLVYTEERDTFDFERFPVLQNRGLVIKVTRLLRL